MVQRTPDAARVAETAASLRAQAVVAAHQLKKLEAKYSEALERLKAHGGVLLERKSHAHLESIRVMYDSAGELEKAADFAERKEGGGTSGGKRGSVRRTSTNEPAAKRAAGSDRTPGMPADSLLEAGPVQDANAPVVTADIVKHAEKLALAFAKAATWEGDVDKFPGSTRHAKQTWFIGQIANYVARSTQLTNADGTAAPRTVEGFDQEVVRMYSKLADGLFGEYGIQTVHAAPYAAMTLQSLRAVAIANWARPDDAMMVTSMEDMKHDCSGRDIFNNYEHELCWYFWILFLLLVIIFGVAPDDARAFAFDLYPFHDKSAEEFKEGAKGRPTGTVKGAKNQVRAAREILRHQVAVMVLQSEKVDDVFLVGADVEKEFFASGGILARIDGAICVEFGDDAMKLSHPTMGKLAGAFSSATRKSFLYTPEAGLKLITPMLSTTQLGYGFGQSGPFRWSEGYSAVVEVAQFVLSTKMQTAPVMFEDPLWDGLVKKMKDTAIDFKEKKEDSVREGVEWKSRHSQWVATRRATAPSPNALPRADGTMPPNALSESATKHTATKRSNARERALGHLCPELHGGPEMQWQYRYFDMFWSERVSVPFPLWSIQHAHESGILKADTLVRPFMALYHQPFVTIEKMVASGWNYPGPAEG